MLGAKYTYMLKADSMSEIDSAQVIPSSTTYKCARAMILKIINCGF